MHGCTQSRGNNNKRFLFFGRCEERGGGVFGDRGRRGTTPSEAPSRAQTQNHSHGLGQDPWQAPWPMYLAKAPSEHKFENLNKNLPIPWRATREATTELDESHAADCRERRGGGVRQRLTAAAEAEASKATSSTAAASELPLNSDLRRDWAKGLLTSPQVQRYALSAMRQGAEGLEKLAAIGQCFGPLLRTPLPSPPPHLGFRIWGVWSLWISDFLSSRIWDFGCWGVFGFWVSDLGSWKTFRHVLENLSGSEGPSWKSS